MLRKRLSPAAQYETCIWSPGYKPQHAPDEPLPSKKQPTGEYDGDMSGTDRRDEMVLNDICVGLH